ncbi:unnamed protein product [Heligmosomoides polygyrus]|uniref:Dentin sialophosphoprotein-like n=1 Tax=Heligmosomoides polygyrus TaxID=6339 RepID=A0A183FEV8_HELPZ|nr:unnamed protein product [Heligmosomoides polygyrus]
MYCVSRDRESHLHLCYYHYTKTHQYSSDYNSVHANNHANALSCSSIYCRNAYSLTYPNEADYYASSNSSDHPHDGNPNDSSENGCNHNLEINNHPRTCSDRCTTIRIKQNNGTDYCHNSSNPSHQITVTDIANDYDSSNNGSTTHCYNYRASTSYI